MFEAPLVVQTPALPLRTCVGCRCRDTQSKLLRMVREKSADGVIAAVADPRRRLWGRGAWLHPCLQCLALALKRRAIGRALPGVVDCSSVQSHIRALGSAEVVVGEQ